MSTESLKDKWFQLSPSSYVVSKQRASQRLEGILIGMGLRPYSRILDHVRKALLAQFFNEEQAVHNEVNGEQLLQALREVAESLPVGKGDDEQHELALVRHPANLARCAYAIVDSCPSQSSPASWAEKMLVATATAATVIEVHLTVFRHARPFENTSLSKYRGLMEGLYPDLSHFEL